MRLLLDENLPKKLKQDFVEHDIFSIREMQWQGITNGKLLSLLLENKFDALLTFDKNLEFQQNFLKYPIAVFVLHASINSYIELSKLSDQIHEVLNHPPLRIGAIVISNK